MLLSTVNESRALLEFAQEKKMSPNMLMFVRTAVDKIETTLKEFEKRKQLEAAAEERKKTSAPAPAIFTDKEISVKPLKGEGAKVCYSCSTEIPFIYHEDKLGSRPSIFGGNTYAPVLLRVMCAYISRPVRAEVQHQEVHGERDARPFLPGLLLTRRRDRRG